MAVILDIGEQNNFSNSESLCHCDASHEVLAQSHLRFGRCRLNFKMATTWVPSWGLAWILERNNFSNSESLCCSEASHKVSAQSDLWLGRRCCLKDFRMAAVVAILNIRTE